MSKKPSTHSKKQAILNIQDLNVYYGSAHVIQGIDLNLERGILAVVGRNGMGKTTLCNAIMGLLPVRRGSIYITGHQVCGSPPHAIANLGVGYVPQGRRLWPSLTVNEHLKLAARRSVGAWNVDSIYQTFPHLANRRSHGGAQLSGGEQQMLAIARALLANPRLLIMDEPTEGLAPTIVQKIEGIIADLAGSNRISILIIEQNIGVATSVSDSTAIMINGQIKHLIPSSELAANRQLQQELLGVKR